MTVKSAWHSNPGQTRADTRLSPIGTFTPLDATQTRAGVVPGGTGLNLTGATMTGTIAIGRAVVQGTATQGAYPVVVTAAETFTVANGHASLPRIDSVFAVAYDQLFDSSGQTLPAIVYTQGTANASPVAPSAPATGTAYLKLWDIAVPAGASAGVPINWATALTDQRVYTVAVGGIVPSGSVAGAYVGQWRDNAGVLERWTGSVWESTLRVQNGGTVLVGDVPITRTSAGVAQVGGGLVVTGVGGFVTLVKPSNTTVTNNATLGVDPHITLPVVANAQYLLDGYLDYDGTFGAGGIQLDWSVPAGASMRWAPLGNASADTTQKYTSNGTPVGSAVAAGTYGTGGQHNTLSPRGYLATAGTAGNITLRWAQAAASAGGTTLYANSWVRLHRIA